MTLGGIEIKDLPVVFFEDGSHLVNPDLYIFSEKDRIKSTRLGEDV